MRGQLWSREELMEKYGIPEGDQKEEDDDDNVPDSAGVPPPVPPQRGSQGLPSGAADLLAATRQLAGHGLRLAAARTQALLAAARKVRHAWQDTKWARVLWRALRRHQQSHVEAVEQEL